MISDFFWLFGGNSGCFSPTITPEEPEKYDTDTATFLGDFCYSDPGDFNYYEEELYQKRTGEFFIYGKGGPRSPYAKAIGQNSWTGSENIVPLTIADAMEWAEKNMDVDDYEDIFGEVEE